jgi:ribonuclease HI
MKSTPDFVLFSRTGEQLEQENQGGSWYFRLESAKGDDCLEASDVESDFSHERLELLAVVRGLEALEQPSSVTLVTSSQQVSRAVRQGLEYWRNRDWKWERFGEKVPMKNGDLWKRIDQAMQIHDIRCRTHRVDRAHIGQATMRPTHLAERKCSVKRKQRRPMLPFRPAVTVARWTARSMHSIADALQRVLPDNSPNPHPTM